jgi:pimeloyl-ACP methyl ester carboxylesterase
MLIPAVCLGVLLTACQSGPLAWYHGARRARVLVQRSTVRLRPCLVRQLLGSVTLCGTYDVPENRITNAGRRIALHIVVRPADGPNPDSDAVLPLDGGPGLGAATDAGLAGFVRDAWHRHDIVLIDQRGTGASGALTCPLYGDGSDASPFLGPRLPLAPVMVCRTDLERRADLTQYTTAAAAADIDDVVRALGVSRVDLVGLSYGGRLALEYLRRFAARVRSIVVVSGPPPGLLIPLSEAEAGQQALRATLDDCQLDAACTRAFPAAARELDSVLARLARHPARVALASRATTDTVAWTRDAVANTIYELLYDVAHARKIPYWTHEMFNGRFGDFARETLRAHRVRWPRNAYGLTLSVICSEDVPFIDSASTARAVARQPLGAPLLLAAEAACDQWPRAAVSDNVHTPVVSDVPALIVSGARDPTGATAASASAARFLSNSRVVTAPRYAHAELDACLLELIATFIDRPDPRALDPACVDHPHLPPFAITSPR